MRRQLAISGLILCLACGAFAAGLGDQLLKQGIGGRAAGMGGAYCAVADDASAIFYNPAGLADPGLQYTIGNMDSQRAKNDWGFTLVKLASLGYADGKISSPNGDQITYTALGFGGRASWLNWGANYKSLKWTLAGAAADGWTSDIGLLMRVTPKLKLGLVARDILTTQNRIAPASLRVGFGYKPFDGQLLLAGDAEFYRSQTTDTHFGLEFTPVRGFTLRAGLDRGLGTAGTSLDMGIFSLDYAVLFDPNDADIRRYEAGLKYSFPRERPFSIFKPKEFALLDLSGNIAGGQTKVSLFGGVQSGLDSILEYIRDIAKDNSIDGIIIRIGGFDGGLGGAAVVQEIRAELLRARAKGKKIIVYAEGTAVKDEYYLASVADKIIAAPGSMIGGFGRSIEIMRINGLLNKFGIEWNVLSRGKYKTSFDWTSPKMTREQREMVEALNSDIYRKMLTDIAASRKIKISKVKEIGDGLVFSAGTAKKMGLVDQVGFFRDALFTANVVCGGKASEEVKLVRPNQVEPEDTFFTQMFGVAVIEINGEIVPGQGGQNIIFGGSAVGSDKIAADIRKAGDDVFIKAIILRIDSPGGSAVAAGDIYRAIAYAREKQKTIIASLGSIAASGGYYIAAAADKIVADPSTITGSIGVIGYYPNFAGLLKEYKVQTDVVKEGKHSDMFSGLRRLTPLELRAVGRVIDETYADFIGSVAAGRKLSKAEVEKVAQGRVYTGSQALELKLVDKIGSFSDAVDLAKEQGDIPGEPRLVYYREINPFLQMGERVSSALGLPPLSLQYK